jgi:predicted nucleotide-binding protein
MGRKKRSKPLIFVGSSTESRKIAYAVQENLEPDDALVTVWKQGVFKISDFGLDSLLEALKAHDFGVFIFAPDDLVTIRNRKYSAVRDNVIFELGLFMGRLGRQRTFVVVPRGSESTLHLPTDLTGWNIVSYDPDRGNIVAALGVACNKIRTAIEELGQSKVFSAAKMIEGPPPFTSVSTIGKPVLPITSKSAPQKRRRRLPKRSHKPRQS